MNRKLLYVLFVVVLAAVRLPAKEDAEGFTLLMDGTTFTGWKSANEHTDTFKIEDGAFVTRGERCHLYYIGDEKPFKNFELKVDVMTDAGANGGIYFHTKYQETSWPKAGFECQVNNTQSDWKKTGSVYDVASIGVSSAEDGKWWTQHIIVKGNVVTVKIDGKTVVEYKEPAGAQPGVDFERKLGEGTFALQAHDPKSIVRYKNIRVKRLLD